MKSSVKISILLSIVVVAISALSLSIVLNNSGSSDTSSSQSTSATPPPTGYSSMHKVSFDTKGGTPIDSYYVNHGSKIDRPKDPFKKGYYVESWLNNDVEWSFKKDVVTKDICLTAAWDVEVYSISFDLDGGHIEGDNPSSYTIEDNIGFLYPTKEFNTFLGWFDDDENLIESIVKGMTGDLNLKARWFENLVLKSLDETKGTVSARAKTETSNEVTVSTTPIDNKHHLFLGWFDNNDILLSEDEKYTFEIDLKKTKHVYAKYYDASQEQDWNKSHGVIPTIIDENKIAYGLYPNSVIFDEEIINNLNALDKSSFNNYVYYRHEYYELIENAKIQSEGLVFDNGSVIEEGKSYWFKVEPIVWDILENNESKYKLLSNRLIDKHVFHKGIEERIIEEETILPNNFKYSQLRNWMNDLFYNSAFFFEGSYVLENIVDNSASSTNDPENLYICEDTNDKVFSLSYNEYNNFKNPQSRQCKTTEYVRVKNVYCGQEENNLNCGYYWTRSPYSNGEVDPFYASRCNKNGTLNMDYIGESHSCVRPAIWIEL